MLLAGSSKMMYTSTTAPSSVCQLMRFIFAFSYLAYKTIGHSLQDSNYDKIINASSSSAVSPFWAA